MLPKHDTAIPGILHKPGNSLLSARYSRRVRFNAFYVATINTPLHDVTLLDELHEGFIAGFTLGWTTGHSSNETASAGIEQPTKYRYRIHFGQVTDDCILQYRAFGEDNHFLF